MSILHTPNRPGIEQSPGRADFDTRSYFKSMMLNEVLFGLPQSYFESQVQKSGIRFNINFSAYYICLTGLKKEVYTGVYGLDTQAYLDVFHPAIGRISAFLTEQDYRHEIVLVTYMLEKQVALLLSPGPRSALPIAEIAGRITAMLQSAYEKHVFRGDSAYSNFTALSPLLRGYPEAAPAFASVQKLANLSFFHMRPLVVDAPLLEKVRAVFSRDALFDLLQRIDNAVVNGSPEETAKLCDELFLGRLKRSFDFSLCEDAVFALKQQVFRYASIYDIALEKSPDDVFRMVRCANIERLHARCREQLVACARAASSKGSGLSHVTLEAIRYIKANFREDISLEDVAGQVNVVPSYLSRVFSRELGVPFRAYLADLRLSAAKELLAHSTIKVSAVAAEIGLKPKYFSQFFRHNTGLSPQAFRKQHRL